MRIPGLAKFVKTLILVCHLVDVSGPIIRVFVPSGSQSAYDTALGQIKAACDVIRAIDYSDAEVGSNPLWGVK